ncbi:ALP1-like protein [Tanacetum coccineum]
MLGSLDCTDWAWFGCPIAHKAQYCRRDHGKAPEILFVANDVTYPLGYYLCDGIYPGWVPFVKSVINLSDDDHKRLRYKAMHEGARKDVERAFDALKKQWAILATPAWAYIKEKLANIMYTCIILHNMIIKTARMQYAPNGI